MARLIVEFLGPSGVGKTTILKSILRSLRATNWQSLGNVLETNLWRIPPTEFTEVENILLELRFANQLNMRMVPADLMHNLFFEYHHMSFEAHDRRHPSNARYLADEHIFQLYIQEINFLLAHDPEKLMPLLSGRAFVFLTRPMSAIIDNIKRRRKAGEYRVFANNADDAALAGSTQWFVEKVPELKRYFTATGTPFVEVDLEDTDAEKKIIGFLHGLDQSGQPDLL